jgi:hypothetical protein
MNERIHELAVQAEKLADEATNAYNDDTGNWRKVWNEVYDEKFAELIVQECVAMIKGYEFALGRKGELSKTMREYFGVEE